MTNNAVKFIPVTVASVLVLAHLLHILTTIVVFQTDGVIMTYDIVTPIKWAGIALLPVLLLFFFRVKLWKYLFLGIIIMAFTPYLQFYDQTFFIIIGSVRIELTALFLLILHLLFNPETLTGLSTFSSPEEKIESSIIKTDFFEKKFATKEPEELQKIIDEHTLVPEAIAAARKLLGERRIDKLENDSSDAVHLSSN